MGLPCKDLLTVVLMAFNFSPSTCFCALPEQVKDFECLVYNYESMVCTWNYGENFCENMPNVKFLWRNIAYSASWTNCNNLDVDKGTCTWDKPTDGYFKDSNLTMRLILEQKSGIKVSSELNVDTTKIVKPDSVLTLSATVSNSTCIRLTWDTSYIAAYNSNNFHRIVVSSNYDNFTQTFNISQEFNHIENICDLHPYTKYIFNVSIKPSGKYAGYWSEAAHDVARTYSDIPSASPQLIDGVYTSNHLKCQGTDSKRRVCVYWKPIRKEQENGQMKGIQGSFTALSDKTMQTQENWAKDSTYGCSELMCNLSYDVTIQARNVNGTSEAGHPLNIPKNSSEILPPQFIVEWDNISNVYISWERRGHTFIKGYTVTWCRNKNGQCELTQEVGWKRLSSNTSEAVLQIDASAQDFLYGVSASTATGSTWVTWQDCVYQRNSVPTREPQNVGVSTGSEDNTLLITWDKLTCQTDEPYIWLYTVRYWKINGGSQKSVNVSSSGEAIIVLNNLENDQTYSVTVRGVTKEGHEGPESRPQTGVPVSKSLKPSEIAGITISVIVCVLLAGVGIFCVIRRCKKKAKRVLKQARKITIPAQPDEDLFTVNRENSDYSECAITPFLEDQTQVTATEQEVGHNANGYISAETATFNLALSHRMSDLHDTKKLSDPALKFELKNESHLVENDNVPLAETIITVLQNQNNEENTTVNSSKNDRSNDYVKCNQVFFDSDTDNNNDNQNDTSEINDNEDSKNGIPRIEYSHQNINNDSTNVHANLNNQCGNELCEMSSTDGENCHPQHIKNDSYIQLSDFDLQPIDSSTSGLERCNSLTVIFLQINRKNSDYSGCTITSFLEDQTQVTATEPEVGHNANGYISAETATLNLALSHRMSDLHDTKMLSDPALKFELKNESHLVENDHVPLAETIITVLQNQNNEENTTVNSSTNDRSNDYVKCNQVFFDSDTDNNNDNQNDKSEINDNEDSKNGIPRIEFRHQNINNDSTNVHANLNNQCGNELCEMSSTDGENCHPQHIKNGSYIQLSGFDLQPIDSSTSGLERCNSLSSGNSNNHLLDSQTIKAPLPREITHEVGDPILTENSVPRGLSHDTKGYVSDRLDAIVPREFSHDTGGYFSHQVDAPVSKALRHDTNRYVSGPIETSDPRRLTHDINGYVPHPVEAPVPRRVIPEINGHISIQMETSVPREHKHEAVGNAPYQLRTPVPKEVILETEGHSFN